MHGSFLSREMGEFATCNTTKQFVIVPLIKAFTWRLLGRKAWCFTMIDRTRMSWAFASSWSCSSCWRWASSNGRESRDVHWIRGYPPMRLVVDNLSSFNYWESKVVHGTDVWPAPEQLAVWRWPSGYSSMVESEWLPMGWRELSGCSERRATSHPSMVESKWLSMRRRIYSLL